MTDVFGNYVIQKVLEHGTTEQRDVIASILTGHAVQLALQVRLTETPTNWADQSISSIGRFPSSRGSTFSATFPQPGLLTFSSVPSLFIVQMYGCRVVQKALEVIGVQRLLSLVAEFEGHVLKVRYTSHHV
jgi:hypothetical protein